MMMPSRISSTIAGRRSRGKKPSVSGATKAAATTISRLVKWTSGMSRSHVKPGTVTRDLAVHREQRARLPGAVQPKRSQGHGFALP